MDYVTYFCAWALCLCVYLAFCTLICYLFMIWDKHSKHKSNMKIERRRRRFERECREAGERMHRADELRRLMNEPIQRSIPIRKAVGYFSDSVAQMLVK